MSRLCNIESSGHVQSFSTFGSTNQTRSRLVKSAILETFPPLRNLNSTYRSASRMVFLIKPLDSDKISTGCIDTPFYFESRRNRNRPISPPWTTTTSTECSLVLCRNESRSPLSIRPKSVQQLHHELSQHSQRDPSEFVLP